MRTISEGFGWWGLVPRGFCAGALRFCRSRAKTSKRCPSGMLRASDEYHCNKNRSSENGELASLIFGQEFGSREARCRNLIALGIEVEAWLSSATTCRDGFMEVCWAWLWLWLELAFAAGFGWLCLVPGGFGDGYPLYSFRCLSNALKFSVSWVVLGTLPRRP